MKTIIFTSLLFLLFTSCHETHHHDNNEKEVILDTIDFDKKLANLGIELTEPSVPVANYVDVVQTGKLLFLAGKGPKKPDGTYIKGKIGKDLTQEEGYEAAHLTAIRQLSVLKYYLGDLNKVKRIVKVFGMVNCTDDFENQPEVINGFSDTMVKVFEEKGKHARAAVGMSSLPRNTSVEIDMVVEIY